MYSTSHGLLLLLPRPSKKLQHTNTSKLPSASWCYYHYTFHYYSASLLMLLLLLHIATISTIIWFFHDLPSSTVPSPFTVHGCTTSSRTRSERGPQVLAMYACMHPLYMPTHHVRTPLIHQSASMISQAGIAVRCVLATIHTLSSQVVGDACDVARAQCLAGWLVLTWIFALRWCQYWMRLFVDVNIEWGVI